MSNPSRQCFALSAPESAVTLTNAAKLLAIDGRQVRRLIDLEVLHTTGEAKRRTACILLTPGASCEAIYREFARSIGVIQDLTGLQRYRDVRRLLGISASVPSPAIIILSAFHQLERIGNFSLEEASGLISIHEDHHAEIREKFEILRGIRRLPYQLKRTGNPKEIARQLAPESLKELERTCLCPRAGHLYAAPPVTSLHAIEALGPLRDATLLLFLFAPVLSKSFEWTKTFLAKIARVDAMMAATFGRRMPTGQELTDMLRRYLDGEIDLDPFNARSPTEVLHGWLGFENLLRQMKMIVTAELWPFVSSLLPPPTVFSRKERSALFEDFSELAADGRGRRKSASAKIRSRLESLHECASNRKDEITLFADAARHAAATLTENASHEDVNVEFNRLDDQGIATDLFGTTTLRVWRASDAATSIVEDCARLSSKERRDLDGLRAIRRTSSLLAASGYLLVEVVSRKQESEPYFIELLRQRVTSFPSLLQFQQRISRLNTIERLKLPGYRPARGGFLKFSGHDEVLARYGDRVDRLFIPLFEFERALRYAALFFDCASETMRRQHEVSQLVAGKLKENTDEGTASHDVLCKASPFHRSEKIRELPLCIRQEIADEASSLDKLQMSHFGWSEMPLVMPEGAAAWKVSPDRFTFSWSGTIIGHSTMYLCLAYLFVGWPKVTGHLLRHAGAEEAGEDDVPPSIVQTNLGQRTPAMTSYYMTKAHDPNDPEQSRDDERRIQHAEDKARKREVRYG